MTMIWIMSIWMTCIATAVSSEISLTGCQVCDTTGDCSKAYLGGPGQFCGHWLDRANQQQSCCCPNDAICRVSNYACNCAHTRTRGRPGYVPQSDPLEWLWWLLGAMLVVAVCGGCLFWVFKRAPRQTNDRSNAPVAYPIDQTATYGASEYTAAPVAAAPVYGAPTFAGYPRQGMGAGTGAALGGAAGLAGGLLLGHSLADHGHRYDGGYYGGYDGGGYGGGDYGDGGYDGGTFGGDF